MLLPYNLILRDLTELLANLCTQVKKLCPLASTRRATHGTYKCVKDNILAATNKSCGKDILLIKEHSSSDKNKDQNC